jgi:serine O-acetyltransferase
MIKSKEDYHYYLEADRIALGVCKPKTLLAWLKGKLLPNVIWEFEKTLRKVEYYKNCRSGVIAAVCRYYLTKKYHALSMSLGFSIPANVFGPGLSIAHAGTIVVNGSARIGDNCRLHSCVNIGTEAGYSGRAPIIGSNCYIGPGTKIYGSISIGDGTAMGANCVVNRSFDGGVAIAGVPAKIIADVDTSNFVIPATHMIRLGIDSSSELIGLPAKVLKEKLAQFDTVR